MFELAFCYRKISSICCVTDDFISLLLELC
jgi:hypothetical protein